MTPMMQSFLSLATSAGWQPNKARYLDERDKALRSPELVTELRRKAEEKRARKAQKARP